MQSSEIKSSIPKLQTDGSNWVTYRDRLVLALESLGLDIHLTNDDAPKDYGAKGDINGLDAATHWKRGESGTKQLIAATVPETVFSQIKSGTRAKEMWEALKKLHEERSRVTRVTLLRKFRNLKCEEGGDVRTHFEELAHMREQLAAMGKNIDEDDYVDILLASLPSSYQPSVSAINASTRLGKGTIKSDDVIELMTDEYERLAPENKKQPTQDQAFTADPKRKECTNCKRRGHVQEDCWAPGGGQEGQGPQRGQGRGKERAAAAHDSADIEAWAAMTEIEWEGEGDDQQAAAAAASSARTSQGVESELYDSGASRHMSPFRHRFITYHPIDSLPITAADKRVFYAVGMGDLQIEVPNGESSSSVILKDVLHAPDMALTIVSIGRIARSGCAVIFEDDVCRIKRGGKIIGVVPASANGLYRVDHLEMAGSATTDVSLLSLHRRLGHISALAIRTLVRQGAVTGINLTDDGRAISCESCEYAKTTRKVIRKEREEPLADAFGDEIHSDVWGPSPTTTLGRRNYYITFTDDHTRYTRLTLIRTKDEALDAYKAFASWAETQHGTRIKRLRSDRGGEYTGENFTRFLKEQGTERRLTTHDTPQHNGVAESLNRRLLERVRAILHYSSLPKSLWGEAIHFAVWLKNRTSTRALGHSTPYERLYGKKPNLGGVPEWGQRVWVHVATGSKLDWRAQEAHWVGYDSESTHAHRIFWPGKNRISVERNVKFAPTTVRVAIPLLPEGEQQTATSSSSQPADTSPSTVSDATKVNPTSVTPSKLPIRTGATTRSMARQTQSAPDSPDSIAYANALNIPGSPKAQQPQGEPNGKFTSLFTLDKSGADPPFHSDLEIAAAATTAIEDVNGDPKTVREARSRSDWPLWKEAMDKEMATLDEAETWHTIPRPQGKNIVGSKWVFRVKRKADGTVDKYKARLVAKGFTQIQGIDYFDTYSPVAKLASLRTILALAARHDWDVESFDFNGAYLNGTLDDDEEIFMQEPPGYETAQNGAAIKRLRKSLYGLKQAGRKWYDALCRILTDLGFHASIADPGVFIARTSNHILILAVHVDDCALTGSSSELINAYKQKLNERYALTDLGPIHWLLGIKISRDRAARTISLSQTAYIESIINRFNLTDAKSASTPMDPGVTLCKTDAPSSPAEAAHMKSVPYREAIGSLMYASVATRPDITFAVSTLSQFLDNPGEAHWEAVKRVFRYLAGTKHLALTYGEERHDLVGYTDADGASQEHRRAISGSAFLIDGGTISWSSRKQELITLSTAEAEYVAATHAAKEGIWLRRLLGEISPPIPKTTTLFCDNQAACKIATTDNFHARTKHIDIRYHFIRQTVEDGTFDIVYCPTDDMVADALTKALPRWKVKGFASALGLRAVLEGE